MDIESYQKIYDRSYFEEGVITGKSCYQNYRWLAETTIKMAYNIIKYLKLTEYDRILDYGCSMGYLVKALRILDIEAYGCDISRYAVNKADPDVRIFCDLITVDTTNPFNLDFDWIISKGVLEHLTEKDIDFFLDDARKHAHRMFHVIPLGDENGKFIIPHYHEDTSHIQIQHESWWSKKFELHGWHIKQFEYQVRGIKENWTRQFEKGNGFFILEKK
jgi:cyclopropane fatty-acyl-phospholipid synthase-like methyltransferase